MSPSVSRTVDRPSGIRIATGGLVCGATAVAVMTATATVLRGGGLDDETRQLLRFGFGGVSRSPAEAATIAVHNASFTAGVLFCAVLVPRLARRTGRLFDVGLTSLLVLNAGAVGAAVAGYGWRAALAVAPHLPLEFGALSLAGGAYISSRHRALPVKSLVRVAGCCLLLVAGGAVIETYVQLGSQR